jgi:hypothetical protein
MSMRGQPISIPRGVQSASAGLPGIGFSHSQNTVDQDMLILSRSSVLPVGSVRGEPPFQLMSITRSSCISTGSIEPQVSISEMVKDLMGGSSHDTKQSLGADTLGWQRGYGVVSFGQRNLPWVLEYIAHQREHHARSKVVDCLERADVDDEG